MSSSLKIQALSSTNRPGVAQLLFDTHMRSVPASFNFLKLRPMALILWTAISTAIFKFRQTHLQNYSEVLTILAGSVILAQAILFLTLLYEASTAASGPEVVGRLDAFGDQDQEQVQDQGQQQKDGTSATATAAKASSGSLKKRSTEPSGSNVPSSSPSASSASANNSNSSSNKEDNRFWVLEQNNGPVIGCIGALVDKRSNEARLVNWAVQEPHQRNGCGTLLLKTAMDQLSGNPSAGTTTSSASFIKKNKVQTVKVVLQGSQVPALRLFYKFGFKQVDRMPEWMGERVELEIATKDWVKNQSSK
ncbi:hypothetical protein BC939DRAFT_457653 [Gamsiella multidivaricata]|uniref:uncharacterized protein n=1 Tax=Gamsiella multidivaricata TaxID=101098 RepID=UPI00222042C5|nr:uncharacterized protein BC939DRAFT_457653 [Gamsiella multidivaricata]KAG0365552.1 hypothetical protein BGZ54_006424 [Gamsiella multidivaricata]KAI7820550.1 hypothetical protein BC939DRAFT_457653 [Gamsiella multidivaricata]